MTAPRTVTCRKLHQELPGLAFKPFPDEFGQELYDQVSQEAWQMWIRESPRLINTWRIDMSSKQGRDFLRQQMRIFFGFEAGEMAQTAWRPPE
jgi:Fe-S cluster biosynthesis and repair protein YggX